MRNKKVITMLMLGMMFVMSGCGSNNNTEVTNPVTIETESVAENTYNIINLDMPYIASIVSDIILKDAPESTAEKIMDLPEGSDITVLGNVERDGELTNYYYVEYESIEGFVEGEYIDFNKAIESTEETETEPTEVSEETETTEVASEVQESNGVSETPTESEVQESSGVSETPADADNEDIVDFTGGSAYIPDETDVDDDFYTSTPSNSALTPEEQALVDAIKAKRGSIVVEEKPVYDISDGLGFDTSNVIMH